jgi:hypothetical protein
VTSALLSWAPPARITDGINRWFDAVQSGRALWVFLALFVAIWTSFQIVSYASIGLHFDLVEVFAWSRHLAPGYKPAAGHSNCGRLVCGFSGCGLVVPSARDGQRRSRLLCDRSDRAALRQRRQATAGAAASVVDTVLPIPRTALQRQRHPAFDLADCDLLLPALVRIPLAGVVGRCRCRRRRCSGNTIRSCWSPGSSSRRSRTPGGSTICDRRRRRYRSWRVLLCWRRICIGTSRPAAKR